MADTRAMRLVLHVVPTPEGVWEVREQRERRGFRCATKDEAVLEARRLAREARIGQVRVHDVDGGVATEWTYGDDPRRSAG